MGPGYHGDDGTSNGGDEHLFSERSTSDLFLKKKDFVSPPNPPLPLLLRGPVHYFIIVITMVTTALTLVRV